MIDRALKEQRDCTAWTGAVSDASAARREAREMNAMQGAGRIYSETSAPLPDLRASQQGELFDLSIGFIERVGRPIFPIANSGLAGLAGRWCSARAARKRMMPNTVATVNGKAIQRSEVETVFQRQPGRVASDAICRCKADHAPEYRAPADRRGNRDAAGG